MLVMGGWARLQEGLQRLAKPWYRLRALAVFRDESGLATNPHLWFSISEALDESEFFVLLASPRLPGRCGSTVRSSTG